MDVTSDAQLGKKPCATDLKVDVSSENFVQAVHKAKKSVELVVGKKKFRAYKVADIPGADKLPYALFVLLENCVRRAKDDDEAALLAGRIVSAALEGTKGAEIPFMPARVLFQDFTGVPVFVDFAAMRDAMVARGGNPERVSPRIPCTLVIDHSVIADEAGTSCSALTNRLKEVERNRERFAFLKWSAKSFDNVRIVPPGEGICHQLNMERFCEVVSTDALADQTVPVACFDSLVGTDSHTTTANGLGILGWGVGGIEAEAAALGQPISMLVPPVVELKLTGRLPQGISGMDLALTVCERLRAEGVVGSLVEVTGDGVGTLSATQRACVANMTPEYGATTTLFPVDTPTMDYLLLTGRSEEQIKLIEKYLDLQGMREKTSDRVYAKTIEINLAEVQQSLAGPSRPHRRVVPADLAIRFEEGVIAHGHVPHEMFDIQLKGQRYQIGHGAVAIAAITSCTTATDPAMMVQAGLLAKAAVDKGLHTAPWVKTILAPGSHAAAMILDRAGLSESLEQLGFAVCGFGCMSCIGNSGPIAAPLHDITDRVELASVLSGNRNFDGRISPDVAQNFLMEPALVVAYALTGTVNCDLTSTPVGHAADGTPLMLSELMPSDDEVAQILVSVLTPELYEEGGIGLQSGYPEWASIPASSSATFNWDTSSTYVRRPSYFEEARTGESIKIQGARALALLGDFVTTDHISPAGSIASDGPAARYLIERGISEDDFNTFGSRRGNHELMMRGTFANVKLVNKLAAGKTGGWTRNFVDGTLTSIFDAAMDYRSKQIPLVIIAGKMYGSGSSRDWAAKGPALLGVRAVLAESFERIHRSNLVQMGVIPLQFSEGQNAETLGLDGSEEFDLSEIKLEQLIAGDTSCMVCARKSHGDRVHFECVVRIDTPTEADFVRAGGILPYVLNDLSAV